MSAQSSTPLQNMPPLAPLDMPRQDLSEPFSDPEAINPNPLEQTSFYRFVTLLPAVATTLALVAIMVDWFGRDGFVATELIMFVLVAFSAFWIALSVAASTIGLLSGRNYVRPPQSGTKNALNVALLLPVYHENAEAVFGRIRAMQHDLSTMKSNHRFSIFVLSDTQTSQIADAEEEQFRQIASHLHNGVPIYYRRRPKNTERKTGNIRQWIQNWGGDWDAFVTLDADSLMSAPTIIRLSDEMAASPEAGLLQTVPQLMNAGSFFGRIQQFANNVYGNVLARGLDRWSGHDGNYWGHNAIIRTRAFARCAGLPTLSGAGAVGGIIKSHDFVEAALLRRAGWSVRLLPHLSESYEEAPQTIVDYVLRDRRWCQGNLQHLRIMFSAGFTPISRFHMFQGAMAYIASVFWFLLLIAWALMGRGQEDNVFRYFTDANPLFPQWPEMDSVSRLLVLLFMFGLLLVPKILGLVQIILSDRGVSKFGGWYRFAISALCEIVASFILAPILMVQHVNAVIKTLLNFDSGWAPQNRGGEQYSWVLLARFHWLETIVGFLLVTGIVAGVISLWLVPIALSLIAAVPISYFSGWSLPKSGVLSHVMDTEESLQPTPIIKRAYAAHSTLGKVAE